MRARLFLALLLVVPRGLSSAPPVPDPYIREAVDAIESTLVTIPQPGVWDERIRHPNVEHWVEERDKLLARSFSDNAARHTALRSLLDQVNDPNTRLMDADEFAATLAELNREAPTTGITDLVLHRTDRAYEITTPIVGSPAFRAGMRPGDLIESVDGEQGVRLDRSLLLRRLRGEAGTSAVVTYERDGNVLTTRLAREVNRTASVVSAIRVENGVRIAYLDVNEFAPATAALARKAIESAAAANVSGFILDLRNNPGGLLDTARQLGGMFMGEARLCSIRRRGGKVDEETTSGSRLTDKPVIVVVDRATVSAAEVLAAALQDNGRARLVGETTFGQGLVFVAKPLSDKSVLLLASGWLVRPSGALLQDRGVTPDHSVPRGGPSVDPASVSVANDAPYAGAVQLLTAKTR